MKRLARLLPLLALVAGAMTQEQLLDWILARR